MAIFITHDSFWAEFCKAINHPQWISDERFAAMHARTKNREYVVAKISEVLRQQSSAHWLERLLPKGIVAADAGSMADSLHAEQTEAREMVVTVNTPHGPLRLVGNPIKLQDSSTRHSPPPLLGEHSAELLKTAGTVSG